VYNRALTAFVDLLAVLWMMRRRFRYRVIENLEGQTTWEPTVRLGGQVPGGRP
jgi:hypothetical protein